MSNELYKFENLHHGQYEYHNLSGIVDRGMCFEYDGYRRNGEKILQIYFTMTKHNLLDNVERLIYKGYANYSMNENCIITIDIAKSILSDLIVRSVKKFQEDHPNSTSMDINYAQVNKIKEEACFEAYQFLSSL